MEAPRQPGARLAAKQRLLEEDPVALHRVGGEAERVHRHAAQHGRADEARELLVGSIDDERLVAQGHPLGERE